MAVLSHSELCVCLSVGVCGAGSAESDLCEVRDRGQARGVRESTKS